jgi:hypothetical protein
MVAINSINENKIVLKDFIKSLSLPHDVANVLLVTDVDCERFYKGFYGRNRYIVDDLLDFRDEKLSNSHITITSFLKMCNNGNVREAFESTFLQSFNQDDIRILREKVASGNISYRTIYDKFQLNTNLNIWRIVL